LPYQEAKILAIDYQVILSLYWFLSFPSFFYFLGMNASKYLEISLIVFHLFYLFSYFFFISLIFSILLKSIGLLFYYRFPFFCRRSLWLLKKGTITSDFQSNEPPLKLIQNHSHKNVVCPLGITQKPFTKGCRGWGWGGVFHPQRMPMITAYDCLWHCLWLL
jgi:hypothetical protein